MDSFIRSIFARLESSMATKIYTKTGDKGTTALFGGTRVSKHSQRIEAYGTVDELNSSLSVVLTCELPTELREILTNICVELFTLGADLATPLEPPPHFSIPRVELRHVSQLERSIDSMTAQLPELKNFILPGGSLASAHLHVARTICRRAERRIVELSEAEEIGDVAVMYINRLSDFLFVASRFANSSLGVEDRIWIPPNNPLE